MAKGRELKGRIKSVENTRKITRTMEMVATSKMKRAQDRVVAARPYAQRAARGDRESLLAGARRALPAAAPAGAGRSARRVVLSRQPRTRRRVQREPDQGSARDARATRGRGRRRSTCTSSARRALGYFRYVGRDDRVAAHRHRRPADGGERRGDGRRPDGATSRAASSTRVYVVYAKFNSALSTPPTTEQVLPVTPPRARGRQAARLHPLADRRETILDELLPLVRAQRGVPRAGRERRPASRARSARQ